MTDLQLLKNSIDIVEIIGHFIQLQPKGAEFVGICPFHNDTNPSLTVSPSKQIFWCPVCDAKGDAFDFVKRYKNVELSEAIQIVRDITGIHDTTPTPTKPKRKKPKPIIADDITDPPPPPIPNGATAYHYTPTVIVTRTPDKKIRPLTFSGGKWIFKAPTNPPLYIVRNGETQILVEGEKTADAVAELGYTAITWMGGTNRWKSSDFSSLTDDVLFWPDNDPQGHKAMQAIAAEYNLDPKWIPAPDNAPKGWDAADGNTDGLIERAERKKQPKRTLNFKPLGFSKRAMQIAYFVYILDKNQVTCYTNPQITISTLRELHPDMTHWETQFPGAKGIDVNAAASNIINACTAQGIFDPDRIRNRGAWLDNDRVVVHSGKKLIVDGTTHEIDELQTEFIYERRKQIDFKVTDPMTAENGQIFLDALRLYNWEKPVFAELLAGWIFVAPICGALNWRPHIWVSGSSGTGKTKLMKDTVWKILDNIAITPEGESTEAGIRQTLDGEALPVLFDEVEADTREAQQRMDGILNLMRSASSGKSGQIMKGGATHSAKSFRIRSCFAFSSIVYQATKKADRSRISVLGLVRNPNNVGQRESWDRYNRIIHDLVDDKFAEQFCSRSVRYLRETIQAAKTFSEIISDILSDRRLGDQIGTMVAGCWMMTNDHPPTTDEAVQYVSSRDYYDEDNDEMEDELQLLRYLMQQGVTLDERTGRVDMNMGELVNRVYQMEPLSELYPTYASKLGRLGMRVDGETLIIANANAFLSKMLADTQWSKNHHKILRRIDGAKPLPPTRFTEGNRSRATAIPINTVLK